jgi:Di-haem oxidoreductase, putative peroxidase
MTKTGTYFHFVFLAVLFCALFTSEALSEDDFEDPRAVDVFPSHDDAASGKLPLVEMSEAGKHLFKTVFNSADGVGRPRATGDSKPTIREDLNSMFNRVSGLDASSCADCHNQPTQAGSGGFATNVFVGAHKTDPAIDTINGKFTNERHTPSLFGSGAINMLAYEMTSDLQDIKKEALIKARHEGRDVRKPLLTKGVDFGVIVAHSNGLYETNEIVGIDNDLVVKPFGSKGVAVSLREFTLFALNQHDGIQADERFGWARTGILDFDGDGVINEFSIGQVSALVIYQASLPAPSKENITSLEKSTSLSRGQLLFSEIGCSVCHMPRLPLQSAWVLEPSPYNRPGAAIPRDVGGQIAMPLAVSEGTGVFRDETGAVFVSAFTDLKRHVICDKEDLFFCNEKIIQDFVAPDTFMTAKLWAVGSSAPYGHSGNITTINEAIVHHSGEARDSKHAYLKLLRSDKADIFYFLKSMQVLETQKP